MRRNVFHDSCILMMLNVKEARISVSSRLIVLKATNSIPIKVYR